MAKEARLTKKEDTDTVMTGVDTGPGNIAQTVQKEVAKALQSMRKKKGTKGQVSPPTLVLSTNSTSRKRKSEIQTLAAQTPNHDQEEGCVQGSRKRQRVRKGEVDKEVDTMLAELPHGFSIFKPETYPGRYDHVSDAARVAFHVSCYPVHMLNTLRDHSPGIFKQPGVTLPSDIEYSLALNHKFILHQIPDPQLVYDAFERLIRSVRIRWHFRNKQDTHYDPRFHVANPDWNPPEAAEHIERGIQEGMKVVASQLRSLNQNDTHRSNPNWTKVQEFLQSRSLLVKLTDKNLGLAVFTVEWYRERVYDDHLSDNLTYRMDYRDDVPEVCYAKVMNAVEHSDLPERYLKYVKAKTRKLLPTFYAIPKVHKVPWLSRPIVPSHSWVTSRLSEVLDSLLRPLLKHYPWIVNSTKDEVKVIETVKLPENGCRLVTGDIKAFYTNVPVDEASAVVADIWSRNTIDKEGLTQDSIRFLLETVLGNNYFQYESFVYQQIRGLAMGTAVAPLVANLYAGELEVSLGMSRMMDDPRLLMYVRYIDDIFLMYKCDQEVELITFLERLQLGTLQINWTNSTRSTEFLDVEILQYPGSHAQMCVATRLYSKPMNLFHYIPWSSAHPLPVKKAFVKAELTRFATICSEKRYFVDAVHQFYRNLQKRGYPVGALHAWFKQVGYSSRQLLLSSSKEDIETVVPLMIPSEYNEIWDYIHVSQVFDAMRHEWKSDCDTIVPSGKMVKSLSRTRNLADLLAGWNKTTLLGAG